MLGKTLLIANPAAHAGEAAAIIDAIASELVGVPGCTSLSLERTMAPGHATELACKAQGFDTLLVLGGDGIVHEAVNGIMRRDDVSVRADLPKMQLGLIPFGSGNDYASTLGMSTDPFAAVAQLSDACAQLVDTGLCNGGYYCQTLSFGLDAAIALDTVERRKRTNKTGMSLYLASGVDQLMNHRDIHDIEMAFDDGDPFVCSIHLLAVQIGRTYGGGFAICPDADVSDGIFDICYAKAPLGLVEATHTFLLAKNGKHTHRRNIEFARASHVRLAFSDDLPIQIDGEKMEGRIFDVRCIRQSLCVLRAKAGK